MKKYTSFNELVRVRTVNMGSLFQLVYKVRLRDVNKTKQFLDELRCRNGNLDIVCTLPAYGKEEL